MIETTQISTTPAKPRGVAAAKLAASSAAPENSLVLSRQQREALDLCVETGELFYSQNLRRCGQVKPRLFPLLCAPSGSGKSMLVATCAERLGAYYRRSQRGDLAPQGASRMRASLFQVLDMLTQHERVLWHIDELDKFSGDGDGTSNSDWGGSIQSDLWSALDGVFPIESYLAIDDRPRAKDPAVNAQFLAGRVRKNLYIVGSGTWQKVFARATRPSLGFSTKRDEAPLAVTAEDVLKSQMISPELLMRFNSNLLILGYPDHTEIRSLLAVTGIATLAREVGYEIVPADLDFGRGGFRVLEALLSRLLLLQHRHSRRVIPTKPKIDISSCAPINNFASND